MLPVIRNDGAATTVCGPAVAFSSRVTSHVHIIPERHRQDVVGDGVRVPLAPKRRLSSSASVTSRRPSCLASLRPGIRNRTVWLRPGFAEPASPDDFLSNKKTTS